jgi:hypothetical protein
MVEYLDSGGGDSGKAVGPWLAEHLVPGVQAVRIQTGYFSIGSLRDHLGTLCGIDFIRLVLGSNAPEQPTADDVRQLVPLISGHGSRSLTFVRFAGSALFHPKTIHLVREDGTALAYVGSANLTEYGLGFNAEAGIVLGPDAGDALDAIAAATDAWADRDEQGVFQVRGEDDVDDLLAQGVLQTAEQRRATRAANRRDWRASQGGGGLKRSRLWRPKAAPVGGGLQAGSGVRTSGATRKSGVGVALQWCKKLSRTDALQLPASGGKNTHIKAELPLTKAKFKNVEPATYFRDVFFKDEVWVTSTGRAQGEECTVKFAVQLGDQDIRGMALKLFHATGRKEQNNYSTSIKWGEDISAWLRANNQHGNWVVLERFDDDTYSLAITDAKPSWAP